MYKSTKKVLEAFYQTVVYYKAQSSCYSHWGLFFFLFKIFFLNCGSIMWEKTPTKNEIYIVIVEKQNLSVV